MSLTLTTLRCPETVPPQTRRVDIADVNGGFSIGRGSENDWVLPDPNRHLSKRHCTLSHEGGVWRIADTSTNGTFLNLDEAPVGPAGARPLQDGDRLRLGMYELAVHIAADQPPAPPMDIEDEPEAGDDHTRVFRRTADPQPTPKSADPDELDTGAFALAARNAAPPPMEIPEDWNSDPFDEPLPEPPLQVIPPLAPASAMADTALPPVPDSGPDAALGGVAGPDLMAAFLRGAGLRKAPPQDAEATMEALGAAFRAVVSGIRQVLLARASIKSEFRIEQTMIRARGNNPLKFSVGDDDALASMIGLGRRTDMPAAEAVRDALRDMQMHELASMAAMQAAVRSLVAQFDPDKIRAGTDQGGISVMPAQRKARAWEAFEALHARITEALADDFDSVFGKAFAIAYERTLHEASERAEPL
jgi:type VI secretion system protein ImpI/type VI secretion system protein